MHRDTVFNARIDRYVLGIILVVIVIPPQDHVAGLKAVSVDYRDPFIVLDSLGAVRIKARKLILGRSYASFLKETFFKARLDACKTGSVKAVFVGISAA